MDAFCEENGVEQIAMLKLDVEGHELSVLRGSQRMLNSRIDFLLVECELLPSERHFIPITDLANTLNRYGISLVCIYDQTHEWSGVKKLQFANALFARNALLSQIKM